MHPLPTARLIACIVAAASLGIGLSGCSSRDAATGLSDDDASGGDAVRNDAPPLDSTASADETPSSTIPGADADADAPADAQADAPADAPADAQADAPADAPADAQADFDRYGLDGNPSTDSSVDDAAEATASDAGPVPGRDANSAIKSGAPPAPGILDGGDGESGGGSDDGDTGDGSQGDSGDGGYGRSDSGDGIDGGSGGGDSDGEGGIEAGPDTLAIIRATQGDLCAECAATMCLDPADAGTSCEGFASSVADGGSSPGPSRTQLCYATLSCILNPAIACYDKGSGVDECYCGLVPVPQCRSSGPGSDSPCRLQEETGLETTDPGTAFNRLYDPAFGAGRANALLICLGYNCGDCLP